MLGKLDLDVVKSDPVFLYYYHYSKPKFVKVVDISAGSLK
jgi:hypothetical protein